MKLMYLQVGKSGSCMYMYKFADQSHENVQNCRLICLMEGRWRQKVVWFRSVCYLRPRTPQLSAQTCWCAGPAFLSKGIHNLVPNLPSSIAPSLTISWNISRYFTKCTRERTIFSRTWDFLLRTMRKKKGFFQSGFFFPVCERKDAAAKRDPIKFWPVNDHSLLKNF